VLRHNRDDLIAALRVIGGVAGQFTEPAAAVGSPGAAMEREEHWSARQIVCERSHVAALRRQQKIRGAIAGAEGR
jgi:hypothetical protein